jgi:hypothetical protein
VKKNLLFLFILILIVSLSLISCVKSPKKIDYPTPSNNQRVYSREITLIWDHFENFKYFEIKLAKSEASLTNVGTSTENRFQVSDLEWGKTYNWQIIGHINATDTLVGPIWTFLTGNAHEALIIGITDYDKASDLSLTDDDALNLKVALESTKLNYTITTLLNRVNKSDIETSLGNLSGMDDESIFTFTYAGHGGYSYSNHESYLYMSDGGHLYMSELKILLDRIPGKKIVIIDACKSGNFINLTSGKQEISEDEARQAAEQFNTSVINTFMSHERGVASQYYVITAANTSQSSWENTKIKNGVFSFFFLDGIGDVGEENPDDLFDYTFNADTNSDNKVTFQEAFTYTAPKVEEFVNNLMGYHQSVQVYPTNSDFVISEW